MKIEKGGQFGLVRFQRKKGKKLQPGSWNPVGIQGKDKASDLSTTH